MSFIRSVALRARGNDRRIAAFGLIHPTSGLCLLREVSVAEGQEVKTGEKLVVIEAMKMENILRAEHDVKVKKIVAQPGASLSVDEVIIEFE